MTLSNEARNAPDGTVYAAWTDRCNAAVGGVPTVMPVGAGADAPAAASLAGTSAGPWTGAEPSMTEEVELLAHPVSAAAAARIVKTAKARRVCIGDCETPAAAPRFPLPPLRRAGHNASWMKRWEWSVALGITAVLIAGCGETSTAASTPTPTAAAPAPPPAAVVKAAMVTAGDVPGSSVGQAPTEGSEAALVRNGLVPSACIKAGGITSGVRDAVGTDVSQPLTSAAKAVTEAVILEANAADTATDIGQATAGARACPASDQNTAAQFADALVTTSTITMGRWTGTRTSAMDTFATGVTRVASYVYFLGLTGGLLVLQLGVAFANVAPSTLYQQQADAIATKLTQRLGAL